MLSGAKTLFIVFKDKDEMYSNQLRKLIHTKDDNTKKNDIVGIEVSSVNIVAWNEKQWIAQKGTVSTSEKVLFIGKVKGTEQLIPIIDEKYNKYGIKYGWAGNQAVLYADSKFLLRKEDYEAFLKEMKEKTDVSGMHKEKKLGLNKKTLLKGIGTFVPWASYGFVVSLIKDAFDDKKLVRDQQYFLGIFELYRNHLDEFMKY